MNKITIKLFCIFIMLMYCLAPLSGVDLNQDNNAHLKNINDTSNDTIDEISNEDIDYVDKEVNKTDIDTSNSTIGEKLSWIRPCTPIINYMHIDDINYGEKPVLYVGLGVSRDSVNYHYMKSLEASCPQFSSTHYFRYQIPMWEINPVHKFTIDENLEPGIYTVNVSYPGCENYLPFSKIIKFQVKRNSEPNIRLSIDNITQGDKLNVKVNADEELNGTMHLKIKDGLTYNFQVINGVGEGAINRLGPGNYTATAIFKGNYLFKSEEVSTTFTVKENNKTNPYVSVNVNDICKGQNATVKINANKSLTDDVKLVVKGITYSHEDYSHEDTIKVTEGAGQCSISNLSAGNYSAIVTFDGNDQFKKCENATAFSVRGDKDPNISFNINDTVSDKILVAEINCDESFNGTVEIDCPYLKYEHKVYVQNGHTQFKLFSEDVSEDELLLPGTYKFTLKYDGDDIFKSETASKTFKVEYADPDLSVQVDDISYGENATVKIKANEKLNGDVKVELRSTCDYREVTVKLKNGVGEVPVSFLESSQYLVNATYRGDQFFNSDSSRTSFKIDGAPW